MDKIDDRYKNGKIYEITSNNTDMVYVGSCIITLKKRLINHKNSKKCSSKYILECGDYNINLIEYFNCNNKDELRIREQYWINKYKSEGKKVINKQNAYRSEEQLIEYQKEYQRCRKPRIEYQKEYRKKNREKLNINQRNNYEKRKEYIKEYNKKNKERIKQNAKEYYLFNSKKVCNGCFDFIEMLKQY